MYRVSQNILKIYTRFLVYLVDTLEMDVISV